MPLPVLCSLCVFAMFCARRKPPDATSASGQIVRGTAPERRSRGLLRRLYGLGLVCFAHRPREARLAASTHLLLGGYPAARFDAALAQLTGQKMDQECVFGYLVICLRCALTTASGVVFAVCPRDWQLGVRIPRLSQQAEHADSRGCLRGRDGACAGAR